MTIQEYIKDIEKLYLSDQATEHSYRPALKTLIEKQGNVVATNEPKRVMCGAPDYVITRNGINLGYIEAKDVNTDLNKVEKSDQMKRYLTSLDNLILTDYFEFRFFKDQQKVAAIRIAEIDSFTHKPTVKPLTENFSQFESLLANFVEYTGQTIKSAQTLAKMMARKAQLMRDVFQKTLAQPERSRLHDQLTAFKQILIHDMSEDQFADVYAQTITYGLFTARLHDASLKDFSRQEARELIPRSNPFLRKLFDYVCGADLDPRVVWIVDALCEVYRYANVHDILHDFGKSTGRNDPIVHFYETFLGEYDSKLRKARGVWYTPEPVVNFIVRAVDDVLKDHFGLPDGIADTSKVTIEVDSQNFDKRTKKHIKEKKQVHKVQMLDVATGTGTFTAEVIKQIYAKFQGQEGMWSQYVEDHLLPRLHGFEILMASYAICHLKIDLLLTEMGYRPSNPLNPPRLGVYLANSLEEHHPDTGTLFASWLAQEANEASRIKRDMPIMVAYGNPPYSVSSQNKGEWIQNLIADYKTGLNEKKLNLDDDYIKFIRYAEHYVEKTGYGIVAMITNNSFLDGVTHRQMRKHLLETFDHLYIYDLHGSSTKKETAPDGSPDKNVFDIMQGVSISIMVKDGSRKGKLAEVNHFDSYGSREGKYQQLWEHSLKTAPFKSLEYREPYFFFVPKDNSLQKHYQSGFNIKDLMAVNNSGITTDRDELFVDFDGTILEERMKKLLTKSYDSEFAKVYRVENSGSYKILEKLKGKVFNQQYLTQYLYRPFDVRIVYYDHDLISRAGYEVMKHIFSRQNWAFIIPRQATEGAGGLISKNIMGHKTFSAYHRNTSFPLYIYPEPDKDREIFDTNTDGRKPNLNNQIVSKIATKLGVPFVADHELKDKNDHSSFSPLDLLDYMYAVLHSPWYRETYKELLKIDFPRLPYPDDIGTFWKLIAIGGEIRQFHLMEHPAIGKLITTFPASGECKVEKPVFKNGKVYINSTQYFDQVPEIAWNFFIGGYQPAQKWLKDRKDRTLSFDDIRHWQKIIVALVNTDRLMKEIDEVFQF